MREPQIKSTSLVAAAIPLEELLINGLYRSIFVILSGTQLTVAS